ncbi:hypothetical protein [Shewanella sp. NIFS-20-20]|uniref:hypothetical protein n=1 Tax=Shewanella sp. NIFS-20-20 TaxID=2853806 RepID=UPI001C4775B7|nr:hypothetical protein [Shewanella sp. NIFS-20-20]MBV7315987.1 hypothetical protein [Shewanella sp. NIFS-20-20]
MDSQEMSLPVTRAKSLMLGLVLTLVVCLSIGLMALFIPLGYAILLAVSASCLGGAWYLSYLANDHLLYSQDGQVDENSN